MLVLTRKKSQLIQIGDNIVIKIIRTSPGSVKIGIDAPSDVRVMRGELDEVLSQAYDVPVTSSRKPSRSTTPRSAILRSTTPRSTPLMVENLTAVKSDHTVADCSPGELVDDEEPVCLADYNLPKTVQAS